MVCNSKLIVEVSNVLTDLGPDDLLFNLDRLEHELLSPAVLLLLSELDSNSLHGSSFFFLNVCTTRDCSSPID